MYQSVLLSGCVKTIVNRMVTESNEKNKNKENVFLFGGERDVKRKRHGGVSLLLKWDLVGGGLFGF